MQGKWVLAAAIGLALAGCGGGGGDDEGSKLLAVLAQNTMVFTSNPITWG